jgi:hypothetical protein
MAYLPHRNRKTGKLTLRYVAPRRGSVAPRKNAGQFNRRVITDAAGTPVYHVTKGWR